MGTTLDPDFLNVQRRLLLRLRARLVDAAAQAELEEKEINAAGDSVAGDREDDAQRLSALELDANIVVRDTARLARVDRALQKLADGTYGLSDISGLPIPRERLEAIPEATCTFAEAQGQG
jgi:DnaK suppressor protein